MRVVIMGAAGRDFHNFNVYFRHRPEYRVVAFTATQIPDIEGRIYPPALAGSLYPEGIPIFPEEEMPDLVRSHAVEQVIFAYSDVSHHYIGNRASVALAAGADFRLMGPRTTMLKAARPVVAVCAVRTGAGKSQTTRRVCDLLQQRGKRVVAIRHPMPYGDLAAQACQRFASYADLDHHRCTIEEREEYEPHLDHGIVVYAGVDYGRILEEAEKEADVIVWDGGNNDLPFYRTDIHITLVDPHRPGHELQYHPGETNLRLADGVIINKIETAGLQEINTVRQNIRAANPKALIIDAASPLFVPDGHQMRGKRVLVIEDGPTLTHGGMVYGAGVIAAQKFGAAALVDPRPFAVGSICQTYARYPHMGALLPAMGYSAKQIRELEETANRAEADLVLGATPIDLSRILKLNKPVLRLHYELQEIGRPDLSDLLERLF